MYKWHNIRKLENKTGTFWSKNNQITYSNVAEIEWGFQSFYVIRNRFGGEIPFCLLKSEYIIFKIGEWHESDYIFLTVPSGLIICLNEVI